MPRRNAGPIAGLAWRTQPRQHLRREQLKTLPPQCRRHPAHEGVQHQRAHRLRQFHALIRRDHSVDPAALDLIQRLRVGVNLGPLIRCLPGMVALRVVQRVWCDRLPIALGVFGYVHEARPTGKAREAREAVLRALGLVDFDQLGISHRGEEPATQAGSAAGGDGSGSADQ